MWIHSLTCYYLDQKQAEVNCFDNSFECLSLRKRENERLKKEVEEKNKKRKELCERLYRMLLDHYIINQFVETKTYESDLKIFTIELSATMGISNEIACIEFLEEYICESRNWFSGVRTPVKFSSVEELVNYILQNFPPS